MEIINMITNGNALDIIDKGMQEFQTIYFTSDSVNRYIASC